MSTKSPSIALLSFENKRDTGFDTIENAIGSLASCGYYADHVARVPFNMTENIVRALDDGIANYENLIILCPSVMTNTLCDYVCNRTGGAFDGLGILSNDAFTAFVFQTDGECRLTFSDIKSTIDRKYNMRYDRAVIRAVGIPQNVLNEAVEQASAAFGGSANFNVSKSYDDFRIEILYSSATPKMALDDGIRALVAKLRDFIYAMEDISLAEQLYRLLKLRRMKIAVCESFTGGGVGERLVEVPGVSEVFVEGLNTYSNLSKMQRLGVKELTLNHVGAVSAETAWEMAEGLLRTGNCDIAISTTGIAGPKSDNTSKPVGLNYIGVGLGDSIEVYKFNFTGDRKTVTQTAINHALFLAYKRLK